MHLEGSYRLRVPREDAWRFISNPELIVQCLPGLEHFEVKDPKTFIVTLKVGISFVRGSFKFTFSLLDQNPPSHSQFEAAGKGAGVSVRLNATMNLTEPEVGITNLDWKTDAELSGLLAELSPSLIEGGTYKFTNEFFGCVKQKLEAG